MKISALGWVCVKLGSIWMPVFKLTDEQMETYNTFKEFYRGRLDGSNIDY